MFDIAALRGYPENAHRRLAPDWFLPTNRRRIMPQSSSRRVFLQSSAVAAGALSLAQSAYAAGSDILRVGLIGCGGRGTKAAIQALAADKNAKLTAMGDVFEDRLNKSFEIISQNEAAAPKVDVPKERRFTGFDAYQHVIENADVVLLTTPPHFRPMHLDAAVDAGRHVFAEKPVAVDAPGVRQVLAACQRAKEKKLSIVSGLCLRYCYGFQELVKRIYDGQIGDIHSMEANDYRGTIWMHPRRPEWTDMHWQMRNWYYFTWLSGDFNVEQHVHFLDICSWAKGNEYPVKAIGMGGRERRKGKAYGNIFDHHSVVYEYKDGARLYSNTRQMAGCRSKINAFVTGSKGQAAFVERRNGVTLTGGGRKWVYQGEWNQFYQTEHDELFDSIRNGKARNNGEYMAHSTLLAIMGRMATYTGQEVTWKQAVHSTEVLGPGKYEWGPVPMPAIAKPGVTKVV